MAYFGILDESDLILQNLGIPNVGPPRSSELIFPNLLDDILEFPKKIGNMIKMDIFANESYDGHDMRILQWLNRIGSLQISSKLVQKMVNANQLDHLQWAYTHSSKTISGTWSSLFTGYFTSIRNGAIRDPNYTMLDFMLSPSVGLSEFGGTRILLKDVAMAICTPFVSVAQFVRLWHHYTAKVESPDLTTLFELTVSLLSSAAPNVHEDTIEKIQSSFLLLIDKITQCDIPCQNLQFTNVSACLNKMGAKLMNWLILSRGVIFSTTTMLDEWTCCLEDDAFMLHVKHYSTDLTAAHRLIYWIIKLKRLHVLEKIYLSHPHLFLEASSEVLKVDFLSSAIVAQSAEILNLLVQNFKLPSEKVMSSFRTTLDRVAEAYSWRGRERINLFDVAVLSNDLIFLNQVHRLVKPSRKLSFENFVRILMISREAGPYMYPPDYIVNVLNILIDRQCYFHIDGISKILSLVKYFSIGQIPKFVEEMMNIMQRVPKHNMMKEFQIKL
jgi:hypothetical protein